MAKKLEAHSAAPNKPAKPKSTVHSYRVERLSTYEYQGFRLTKAIDGTFSEAPFGKPNISSLVLKRMYEAMNLEANEVFIANKKTFGHQ